MLHVKGEEQKTMKAFIYETPFATIGIAEESGAVTNIFFGTSATPEKYDTAETPLIRKAYKQVKEYLAGKRTEFDFPLAPQGTAFEQAVWNALLTIPYGELRTYGEIAAQIDNPKACRAVGRANGANPIAIVIPCHRVIGANGTLTGYSAGMEFKEFLLKLEGSMPQLF